MSFERQWLPPPEVEAALSEHPRRFRSIFKALKGDWEKSRDLTPSLRSLRTMEWLSLVNSLEVDTTKASLTSQDVNEAVELLLDIIFSSEDNLAARARWTEALVHILSDFQQLITCTLPWRPFYEALNRYVQFQVTKGFAGPLVRGQEVEQMVMLSQRARRWFPPGAAAEIWEELRPMLSQTHQPEMYSALGFLTLLMPTQQISRLDADWNSWMGEWVDSWESVAHSSFWDSLWLTLMARLAKHDSEGAIDWEPFIPRIFTKALWAFQVPVGTANAIPPYGRKPPEFVATLFRQLYTKRAPRAAKLMVWLLGRVSEQANGDSQEQDVVLLNIERLGSLLEQYFHPSNNGKWTSTFAYVLDKLVRHLFKRATWEQSPENETGFWSSDDDEDCWTRNPRDVVGNPVVSPRAPLSEECQTRLAKLIVRLACTAQFAKDGTMAMQACLVLAKLTAWIPDVILPIVHERFQMALETAVAVHQLPIAIHTLAICARTLLLVGLRAPEGEREGQPPRIAAAQAVVAAMHAVLPGIDANDDQKTRGVFRFYSLVLASIGELKGGETSLPLYTEEWLEDLLARVFELLTNLDLPEDPSIEATTAHLEDGQSFLLHDDCMYRPMLELLLARLPAELRTLAIKRIARFILQTTLPSIATEASVLCNVASETSPAESAQFLLRPLLENIEAELPSLRRAAEDPSGFHISKAQEASLRWHFVMLAASCHHAGPYLPPLKDSMLRILDCFSALPSQRLAEVAASFLRTLLTMLASFHQIGFSAPSGRTLPGTEQDGTALEEWTFLGSSDSRIVDSLKPRWHVACEEELAFAEVLIQRYLLGSAQKLASICKGGASDHGKEKETLIGLTHFIKLALLGLGTNLPDFSSGDSLEGEDLSVKAKAGSTVGSVEVRQEVSKCLLLALRRNFSDPDIQQHLLMAADEILLAGLEEHAEQAEMTSTWRTDDQVLRDERPSFRLNHQPGKWRVLRPKFMQVQRSSILLKKRAAASAYRPLVTDAFPKPPLAAVPSIVKDLAAEMLCSSMTRYQAVATTADNCLQHVLKRHPALLPCVLPTLLCALGGLELPSAEAVRSSFDTSPGESPSGGWRVDLALVERLAEAARNAATQTMAAAELSAADQSIEDGRVRGAVTLLSSTGLWRVCTRHLEPSLGLTAAILASCVHRSPNVDPLITNTFVLFVLRYLRPAGLDSPEVAEQSEHLKVIKQLLLDLGSAAPKKPVHWRFSLMANGMLLMLLPPQSPQEASLLARHSWPHICNQLSSQRNWAGSFFIMMADGSQSWNTAEMQSVVRDTISAGLEGKWAEKFLELFSYNHPFAPQQAGGTQGGRAAGRTKEDMLVKVVTGSILKRLEWPRGRPTPPAMQDASISVGHVNMIMAFAQADPEKAMSQFQGPVGKALEGVPQRENRPMTLMAIESLTALICSGVVFSDAGPGDAWQAWVRPLLKRAFDAASLDFGDAWAAALRYSLHCLPSSSELGFEQLLELLGDGPPADADSVPLVKWLKAVNNLLCELSTLDVIGAHRFPSEDRIRSAGQLFQQKILAALPALSRSLTTDVRSFSAKIIVMLAACTLPSTLGSRRGAADTMEVDSPQQSQLSLDMQRFLDELVQAAEEGAEVIAREEKQSTGETPQQNGRSLLENVEIARLATCLAVIKESLKGGESICGLAMQPYLLRMLPAILKIQEMAAPELQPLALEAKSAAVLLKYLPLSCDQVPGVIAAMEAVSEHEQWPARAAALVYTQYFWFRHLFLLSGEQSQRCQQLVVKLMRDKKLEVQELAASTLSGMLKGLSEADFNDIQADLLRKADQMFPRRRSKASAGPPDAAAVVEKHAVVLGLKAFVLCTPYDVPIWLPKILMALVQASTQPPPIKSTVRKTLGEFKRTHEQAGLQEVKRLLTSDEWEAVQGIASPASYFA